MWFDENGLAINSGKSARYDRESLRLSWTEAESRIRRLVENGSYLSPERAAKTWDNEAHELAESLWYLRVRETPGAGSSPPAWAIRSICSSTVGNRESWE